MDLMGTGARMVAGACFGIALLAGPLMVARHRTRWYHYLRNLGVIALCSTLMCVGLGIELNRDNAWYATTDDLVGGGTSQVVAHEGAKDSNEALGGVPLASRRPENAKALPALPSPGNRAQRFQVPTSTGGRLWGVTVILPEGYEDPANANRNYPVLMAAHGVPGSANTWQSKMSITQWIDPLVKQNKVAPFIAVVPELMPQRLDSECIMGPDGDQQMENWLSKDVPAFVKKHLRVIEQREAWSWVGYSAGGWCAAAMTMLHPEAFGAGISLGGYMKVMWGGQHPSFADNSPQAKRLDLTRRPANGWPKVALFIQTSKQDSTSWPSSKAFFTNVKSPTYVTSQVHSTGGHSWTLWQPGFVDGMMWLGQTVPAFHP